MTIDASIAIFFLVVIFYFTLTTALLVRSEVILHTIATHTSQEVGQYSTLIPMLKNKNNTQKNEMLDVVTSFVTKKQVSHHAFNQLQQQLLNLLSEEGINTDGNISLENLKGHRVIIQFLVKEFFKQYIPGENDTQKSIYLKRLGVLGGLDGLSFNHSKLFKKNKEWYAQIAVSCRLRGLYFQFLNYYHFIRHKIIVKVW